MSEILPNDTMFRLKDKCACYVSGEDMHIPEGTLGWVVRVHDGEVLFNDPLYVCKLNHHKVNEKDIYLYKGDMILIKDGPYNDSIRRLRKLI